MMRTQLLWKSDFEKRLSSFRRHLDQRVGLPGPLPGPVAGFLADVVIESNGRTRIRLIIRTHTQDTAAERSSHYGPTRAGHRSIRTIPPVATQVRQFIRNT
jgi:hypothetical protein